MRCACRATIQGIDAIMKREPDLRFALSLYSAPTSCTAGQMLITCRSLSSFKASGGIVSGKEHGLSRRKGNLTSLSSLPSSSAGSLDRPRATL